MTETSFEDLHELPPADQCKDSKSPFTEDIGNVTLFIEDCPKCRGSGYLTRKSNVLSSGWIRKARRFPSDLNKKPQARGKTSKIVILSGQE